MATLSLVACSTLAVAGFATAEPEPGGAGEALEPVSIDPPAPPGSGSPALAAENVTTLRRGHDVLLTWLEPGAAGGRLRFARLSEETWTRPVTVAEPVSTLDPRDRPSLTVLDTQAVRRTLIARTGDVVARSGDAGRTWARLPAPPLPFASFAGGDEGGYAFWLDAGEDGSSRLVGTRVMAGEELLDPRVAAGSITAAAMTWDGPVVVYRGEGAEGAGEIAIVRREDARWTPPRPLEAQGRGSEEPATGPRVAALRRRLAVAWPGGSADACRVLVAFSSDAGRTFEPPIEVDETGARGVESPCGPVDVALDDAGNAIVLWAAGAASGETTLNLARVSPEGDRGEALVLAEVVSARFGGPPQIVRAGPRVAVTWVEGEPGRVRAVAVPVAGIAAPGTSRPVRAGRSGAGPGSRAYTGKGRVGEPVPDVELVSLGGEEVSLASLRGRAVLLNLWATWCMPCIAEMPELAALQERLGPEGLVVVGVSVDDEEASEKVRAFVSERKVGISVWLDPEMEVYDALRVRGLPASFVVDREGRILWRRDGVIDPDDPELQVALRRALGRGP